MIFDIFRRNNMQYPTILMMGSIMSAFATLVVFLRYNTLTRPPDDAANPNARTQNLHNSPHPHIVFILADDLGYNDIGYHAINGMSAVRTPHLDALAADGVKLENYYVQPICSPSRSVLMTGRYLIRYGLQHRLIKAPQPTCLPLSETTLPEKLRELGYSTHALGKWHLGYCRKECLPTSRGFDSFLGYAVGGMDHYLHNRAYVFKQGGPQKTDNPETGYTTSSANVTYINSTMDRNIIIDELEDIGGEEFSQGETVRQEWCGKDLWENETVTWDYEGVYSTTLFSEKAREKIERHNPNKPLFLYLAYKNVHRPLQAPQQYVDKFQHIEDEDRRIYAAMTYVVDEGVKNITDTLKKNGMWENTVLVFSTDNGGMISRDAGGNNWPLRGGKWTLWEGGIRAVGFVNSPLLSDDVRGTVNNELMHISDWLPTLVEGVAGGNTEQMTKPLDGVNQWKTISGGAPSNRDEILLNIDELEDYPSMTTSEYEFWKSHLDMKEALNPLVRAGVRRGDYKLITGSKLGPAAWIPAPESGRERLPLRNTSPECAPRGSVVRLFNIKHDPRETCNLARNPKYLPKVIELSKILRRYWNQTVSAYYPAEDPMANPALRGGAWTPWLDDDLQTFSKIYPLTFFPFM